MKRINSLDEKHLATGHLPGTRSRRVAIYLEPEAFELLREMAVADGRGVGTVAAEMVEDAIVKRGPHS